MNVREKIEGEQKSHAQIHKTSTIWHETQGIAHMFTWLHGMHTTAATEVPSQCDGHMHVWKGEGK